MNDHQLLVLFDWPVMLCYELSFCTLPHDSGRVLWFHVRSLCVCSSIVSPSVLHFRIITWVKHQWIWTNLVCALIWRSVLGLLMGKFCHFLTELSARQKSIFLFPDGKLNKGQWILIKLSMCIDILEIWFEIANGKISAIFDSYLPITCTCLHFQAITCVNIWQWNFMKYGMGIDIAQRSGLGLQMGKFHQFLTELACLLSIFSFPDDNLSKY